MRLRVPSGKIRNELPALSDSAPIAIDRIALFAVAALDGDEAADVEHGPHDRELVEFRLVEKWRRRCSASNRTGGSTLLSWFAQKTTAVPGTCSRPLTR